MTYVVGFSRKLHLYGRGIMWFTRSDVSHVYVRQEGAGARDYVLEAVYPAVHVTWRSVFARKRTIVVREFEVVNWDQDKLHEAWADVCNERIGLPYGVKTIAGDALVFVWFWLTGRWIRNPLAAPWQDVCSELVLQWLLRTGLPGFDKLNPNTIAPSDPYTGQDGILQVIDRHPTHFHELPGCRSCDVSL